MAQQVNAPVTMLTTGAQSKGTDGRENRLYVQQNLQEPAAALPHMHTHTQVKHSHMCTFFSHTASSPFLSPLIKKWRVRATWGGRGGSVC